MTMACLVSFRNTTFPTWMVQLPLPERFQTLVKKDEDHVYHLYEGNLTKYTETQSQG